MDVDISEVIKNFNNDEDVIQLKKYYDSLTFMEILGVSRKEQQHSSFLKWLFDAKHNYDLGMKPLLLLIDLLENKSGTKFLFDKDSIEFQSIQTEFPLGKSRDRCDIYISFHSNHHQYAIVFENKVMATENKDDEKNGLFQTIKYYNYFSSLNNGVHYIYVFLAPKFGNNVEVAQDGHFISISYDDIVDSILNPLLLDQKLLGNARYFLVDYIKVLSKPSLPFSNTKSLSMISSDLGYGKEWIVSIRNRFDDLKNMIQFVEDSRLIEFQNDELNEIVIATVWPELVNKHNRNRNVSFRELNIEPGTVLYLSKCQFSSERAANSLFVTTLDEQSTVQYEFNGEMVINKLSIAAQQLSGKEYGLRGINWFVYHYNGEDINLSKYYDTLK